MRGLGSLCPPTTGPSPGPLTQNWRASFRVRSLRGPRSREQKARGRGRAQTWRELVASSLNGCTFPRSGVLFLAASPSLPPFNLHSALSQNQSQQLLPRAAPCSSSLWAVLGLLALSFLCLVWTHSWEMAQAAATTAGGHTAGCMLPQWPPRPGQAGHCLGRKMSNQLRHLAWGQFYPRREMSYPAVRPTEAAGGPAHLALAGRLVLCPHYLT